MIKMSNNNNNNNNYDNNNKHFNKIIKLKQMSKNKYYGKVTK